VLAKVNVDEAQERARLYRIESIPAVKAFRDGKLVLEFVGVLPEAHLRDFLDRLMPSEADLLAKQARAEEESQPAAAEQKYRQALELNREHEEALVGLARVLIARKQDEEAETLLERLPPRGEQAAEIERLRGLIALGGLTRDVPTEAAIRQRLQQEPNHAEARYQLGCLLASQGKHEAALAELLAAGTADVDLARSKVKEAMVKVFSIIGPRSELADDYRGKLRQLLY